MTCSQAVNVLMLKTQLHSAGNTAGKQSKSIPTYFTAGPHTERPPLFDYGHLGPQVPSRKPADIVLTQVDTCPVNCTLHDEVEPAAPPKRHQSKVAMQQIFLMIKKKRLGSNATDHLDHSSCHKW